MASMYRDRSKSALLELLIAIGFALPCATSAQAIAPTVQPVQPRAGTALLRAADYGIDIVRIPPTGGSQPFGSHPPALPQNPQGRLLTLPLKAGSQPNEAHKGWLGAEMDQLELPLALSLGLDNASGVLILNAISGGPADQAGIRFGDVVLRINGATIANISDLRQRIASLIPGSEIVLEVRRFASDDGDFAQLLRRLADGGNSHAMFRLGRLYAAGSGVVRDDGEAVRWFRRGAHAGNVNAMAALAGALLEGRGTPVNQQEGLRLLSAAAARDHAGAMYRLAHILLDGKLTAKDPLEAARLLMKAAGAGHAPAMVEIGHMYATGNGVQADASKAATFYKQAAELGNAAGMVDLGWAYEHGTGIEADIAKAAMWYKRAVELGNSSAMVDLGLFYAQGRSVERNEAAAVALYRRAAALGNAMAMNNLAWMLQSGRGVEHKDPEEAADLMLKALDHGNEFARQRMTKYSSAWSKEFRQALQRRLREAGFYAGSIDGEFRDSTITSLNAYINRGR